MMASTHRCPRLRHNSAASSNPTPQTLKPSLVYAGLIAGTVAGALRSIPVLVLDDAHGSADNKTGAISSIRNMLGPLKARRPFGGNRLVCIRYSSNVSVSAEQ